MLVLGVCLAKCWRSCLLPALASRIPTLAPAPECLLCAYSSSYNTPCTPRLAAPRQKYYEFLIGLVKLSLLQICQIIVGGNYSVIVDLLERMKQWGNRIINYFRNIYLQWLHHLSFQFLSTVKRNFPGELTVSSSKAISINSTHLFGNHHYNTVLNISIKCQ